MIAHFAAPEAVEVDAALTPAETARRDRLVRPADRTAYTAAHLLVRACAADLLGVEPASLTLAQRCPSCGGEDHGRPRILDHPGVHVSLSHTRGQVAAVAAYSPCGVDVEAAPASVPVSALTERERAWVSSQPNPPLAFARLWVRKEALVKTGVAARPDRIDALGPDGPADEVAGLRLTEWRASPALGAVATA